MRTLAHLDSPLTDLFCHLKSLGAIRLTGEEASKYLQGQVTADIDLLDGKLALLACHCDFKGKTWNIGYLVGDQNEITLICHQQAIPDSLAELKKYGVFAKAEIEDISEQVQIVGGSGDAFTQALQATVGALPDVAMQSSYLGTDCVVYLDSPAPRYLALLSADSYQRFLQHYQGDVWDESVWDGLDIKAGVANIQTATSNEFVPQMMNMQCLNAISFEKGCYMGQEVVARTKFLGKNKRAAFVLRSNASDQVKAGDILEISLGENWRRGGTVLRSAALEQQTWLLAVLPNDTEIGATLRLKEAPDSTFEVMALPYELTD